jgi:hypothetical protein
VVIPKNRMQPEKFSQILKNRDLQAVQKDLEAGARKN